MADTTYQTKVYTKQGADEQVIASGGTFTAESGSTVNLAGTFQIGGVTVTSTAAQLNTAATGGLTTAIADPGDAAAIPVTSSGYVPLVSAGAETRTLAAPTFIGQVLNAYFKTDGGDCVVTCATAVNQTGNNTLTFADAGDQIVLMAVESGANLRWRVQSNDGVALSTV
jgi:hypothetical protein